MDKLQWFKFNVSDWMMGKIQKCPKETRGMFTNLCCLYWNKECELSIEDAIIEVDQEHYDILVSKKVIKIDGEFIKISFLDEQMDEITETSKSKSKAAKARWEKYNNKKVDNTSNADAMHVHKGAMQSDAEKRREEERREETPPTPKGEFNFDFDIYLKKINELFSKNLRVVNKKARQSIKARLKEGYTKGDIWNAMQNVANDKWHKDKNYQHCTPQYFAQVKTLDMHSHKPKEQKNQIGATTEYYLKD